MTFDIVRFTYIGEDFVDYDDVYPENVSDFLLTSMQHEIYYKELIVSPEYLSQQIMKLQPGVALDAHVVHNGETIEISAL